ncbi:DR2241 family protein, partial [Halovivax sp.]|uniref:DR2241 family protein n=1 Tax=Halovivax sp. TaxID=1935978 RepID=UPI0025C5C2A1
AADGGVALDGLVVERSADGYRLTTPSLEREGLDEPALRDALADVADRATNWRYWARSVGGEGTARRAFLRWCERAPLHATGTGTDAAERLASVPARYDALRAGIERRWGQLVITAQLAEDGPPGERVYDCRHVNDRGVDAAALETFADPRVARELATEDGRGRYRPLKTAPTLVDGWRFSALSGDELVETVDYFYPATVANWHRERLNGLDVDHWLETAERQTGIYDVVDELPREAVEWMAEACCVDSQCLRRREWHYEADDELGVDGGDEPFPCREPCSLVIAAARKWAILESERERTWTLELTTSELNQLGELVDAVADGRVEDIREADVNDGANRYRARYLQAKRADEDGSLPAEPTDENGSPPAEPTDEE